MIFFSFMAILGYEYTSIEGNASYLIATSILTIISLIYIFIEILIIRRLPLRSINLFFFVLPILMCFIFFFESPESEVTVRVFKLSLGFVFPSIFIGSFLALSKLSFLSFIKWLDILILVLSFGLIMSMPKIIFENTLSLGGMSSQSISYTAAYTFSISLFMLLFGREFPRFTFFQSKIYNLILISFILIQILSIFLSGGRGGFVLLFLSSIILILIKNKGLKINIRFLKILFLVTVTLFTFFQNLPENLSNMINSGTDRIFSYISNEGIDLSETSGRDIVYETAIKMIADKPFIGYGIYDYIDEFYKLIGTEDIPYPHNLFLELMIQGGMFFLLLWLILLLIFTIKLIKITKHDKINLIMIPFSLFPLTLLQFSGTYLSTGMFWFVFSYILSYNSRLS